MWRVVRDVWREEQYTGGEGRTEGGDGGRGRMGAEERKGSREGGRVGVRLGGERGLGLEGE